MIPCGFYDFGNGEVVRFYDFGVPGYVIAEINRGDGMVEFCQKEVLYDADNNRYYNFDGYSIYLAEIEPWEGENNE